MKISMAIIAKNEEENLPRLLSSVKGCVDEIVVVDTGSTDKTKEIAEEAGCKVFDFEWVDDFSAARNYSYSKCTGDIIFWADCDDVVAGAENLRAVCEMAFEEDKDMGAVYMTYKYAHDEYGNCIVEHPKIRLTRAGAYEWRGRIHEDLFFVWSCKVTRTKDVQIIHTRSMEDMISSNERNAAIILKDFKDQGDEKDPRTIKQVADTLYSARRHREAIEYYQWFCRESGWDEERYVAMMRIMDAYIREEDFMPAVNTAFDAMKLMPDWPDAYFKLAQCYYNVKMYDHCEWWSSVGFMLPRPDAQVITTPAQYDIWPTSVLEAAFFEQARFEEAIKLQAKLLEWMPGNEKYVERMKFCKEQLKYLDLVRSVQEVKDSIPEADRPAFAQLLPDKVKDLPSIRDLLPYVDEREGEKDLAIFCGMCHEPWSPKNMAQGIGGSEEAVIHLSRLLTKRGYRVTVYSEVPEQEEGDHDGVRYKQCTDFKADRKHHWDAVVLWRYAQFLEGDFNADKIYLWLHDVQEQFYYKPEYLEKVTGVFLLTDYHRKICPWIPDEKVVISRNGIDLSQFDGKVERVKNKVFYGSSPDRGLDNLLKCWPKIREAVPDATLDIYYGFGPVWDFLHGSNPKMIEFKDDILRMIDEMKDLGVVYHGRVGHKEIAEAMERSDIWGYPTSFQEISCITAMKAQAAGSIPVCSKFAALNETVKEGVVLDTPVMEPVMHTPEWQEKFTQVMVDTMNMPEEEKDALRVKMRKAAEEHFTWEGVADQWDALFSEPSK